MIKLLGLPLLILYFAALIFGLMWYLTYQQLAAERGLSMQRMEAEGYMAIPPPRAADIKRMLNQKHSLEAEVAILDGTLTAQREEKQTLDRSVRKLQKELDDLILRKNANQQGERLARTLTAMKPAQAATALASLDPNTLPEVVEFSLPYIEEKAFAKLMDAIATADVESSRGLAAQILEIIGTSLFSIDSKYQTDLDMSQISATLRKQFGDNGVALSMGASVSTEKQGSRWLITDGQQMYKVRKEKGRLNVYLRTVS